MQVVIFGASGQTGQRLLAQALAAGHQVRAVARRPESIALAHPQLQVVRGDIADQASLERAVAGQDAVLSAIGAPLSRAATSVHADSARAIIAAMEQAGLRRLLCVTSGGTNPHHDPNLPFFFEQVVKRVLGNIYRDQIAMEQIVMASGLDWTIMRPAGLTNDLASGSYRVAEAFAIKGGNRTPRADLAAYMVANIANPHTYRKALAIAL